MAVVWEGAYETTQGDHNGGRYQWTGSDIVGEHSEYRQKQYRPTQNPPLSTPVFSNIHADPLDGVRRTRN